MPPNLYMIFFKYTETFMVSTDDGWGVGRSEMVFLEEKVWGRELEIQIQCCMMYTHTPTVDLVLTK